MVLWPDHASARARFPCTRRLLHARASTGEIVGCENRRRPSLEWREKKKRKEKKCGEREEAVTNDRPLDRESESGISSGYREGEANVHARNGSSLSRLRHPPRRRVVETSSSTPLFKFVSSRHFPFDYRQEKPGNRWELHFRGSFRRSLRWENLFEV